MSLLPSLHEITRTTLRYKGWIVREADQSPSLCVGRNGNETIIVDVSGLDERATASEIIDTLESRILAEQWRLGDRQPNRRVL